MESAEPQNSRTFLQKLHRGKWSGGIVLWTPGAFNKQSGYVQLGMKIYATLCCTLFDMN